MANKNILTDESSVKTAREERAKYMREWRKRNPEKVKEISCRYWANRAEREAKGAK